MAAPAGWIDLGTVGYTDKGNYNPTTTYNKLNVVKYKGSSWVCNLDNTIGKEPTEGIYWHAMMEGVAVATTEKTGTVMPDGETILVDKDGKVSVPTATDSASGLMSAADKAKLDGVDLATTSTAGLVKPDGKTITIKDGVLSGQSKVAIATTDTVGTVKPDGTTIKIADDGTISAESTDLTGYATTEALAKKGDTLSYADSTLKLLSGETVLSEVTIEAVAPYERKDITSRIGELSAAIASGNPEKYDFREGYYFTGASGYEYILSSYCHFHGQVNSYAVIKDRHWGVIVNTKKTHAWNSSGKTTGGYSASELDAYLQDEVLTNVKSDLTALFGDDWSNHLIANNKLLSNAVDETHYNRFGTASGAASSWTWFNGRYIVAPSEIEIYGSIVWSSSGYDTGEACHPLQAFQRFRFNELLGDNHAWLRDVATASDACLAHNFGIAYPEKASYAFDVLGLIAIK